MSTLTRNDRLSRGPARVAYPGAAGMIGIAGLALRVVLGAAVVALALYWALQFPIAPRMLALGLLLYAGTLIVYPPAWLFVIPVVIPVLELGWWSGRSFLTELDLVMMVTCGAGLWRRGGLRPVADRVAWVMVALLVFYNVFVTLRGLLPLMPGGLGTWYDSLSSLNSLREARGFFWALLLLPLLLHERAQGRNLARLIPAGMMAGLVAVFLTILWERWLFTGLANFTDEYRVSGFFFGIMTGGAALDAYLLMVTPFVGALFLVWRSWAGAALAVPLGLAALYSIYVTYSRADYPALLAVTAILVAGAWVILLRTPSAGKRNWPAQRRLLATAGLVLLMLLGGAALKFVAGSNIEKRFTDTSRDFGTRMDHWSNAKRLVDSTTAGPWIGMGRGVFPLEYYLASLASDAPLVALAHTQTAQESYLALRPGEDAGVTFVRQRITPAAGDAHRLKLRLRSRGARERLIVEFCERHVLPYLEECTWTATNVDAQEWTEFNLPVSLGHLGKQVGLLHRPVDISLLGRGLKAGIDIDEVELIAGNGEDLLRNGDFGNGMDYWFVSYGDHLRWHIKNVFLHVYFEGGLFGLLVFGATLAVAGARLARAMRAEDGLAWIVAAAIVAVLFVGLFDSLFDQPRISLLFTLLIWMSLFVVAPGAGPAGPARSISLQPAGEPEPVSPGPEGTPAPISPRPASRTGPLWPRPAASPRPARPGASNSPAANPAAGNPTASDATRGGQSVGTASVVAELEELADLRARGHLTDEEFQKAKTLSLRR